jgi:hypothetical protein
MLPKYPTLALFNLNEQMIEHQPLNHQSLGLSSFSNRSHLLAQRAIQDVTLEAPVLAAEQRRRSPSFNHGKRKCR